jgi:hypothetical protein
VCCPWTLDVTALRHGRRPWPAGTPIVLPVSDQVSRKPAGSRHCRCSSLHLASRPPAPTAPPSPTTGAELALGRWRQPRAGPEALSAPCPLLRRGQGKLLPGQRGAAARRESWGGSLQLEQQAGTLGFDLRSHSEGGSVLVVQAASCAILSHAAARWFQNHTNRGGSP